MKEKILILNVGSTSTKIAVYQGDNELWRENLEFDCSKYPRSQLKTQIPDRMQDIMNALQVHGDDMHDFDIITSRGCGSKPIASGTFLLSPNMMEDAYTISLHPSVIGCEIAYRLGQEYGIPAIEVDATVVDELCDEARISGIPEIARTSGFHALNQRAVVRDYCQKNGLSSEDHNFIVAHMGGGVSVGAHLHGRVVDVNWGGGGEGPFSMDRAGSTPLLAIVKLCHSGNYTYQEIVEKICAHSGVVAYLGTTDGKEISQRIENGDQNAEKVIQAFSYQIAKEIGAMSSVLSGKVEAIILTGGLANWGYLMELITQRIALIAPVCVYPGENEIEALSAGALRVLRGEETPKNYPY